MKVALIRLSSLGDVVHTLGALKPFLERHEVTWIIDESFAPLLEDENIRLIPVPLRALKKEKSLKPFLSAVRQLKKLEPFDLVIDGQGLLKSALLTKLLKGAKWGFDKHSAKEKIAAFFYDRAVHIDYNEHILKRNLLLFNNALQDDIQTIQTPFLTSKETDSQTADSVLFAIGSSRAEKKYPKELFCELADKMTQNVFIIWYSEAEKEEADFIATHSKAKLLPRLSLPKLKAAIKSAALLVGVDSGVSYIGWALGIKTVILFGPTNAGRFCPDSEHVRCLSAEKIHNIQPDAILKVVETL